MNAICLYFKVHQPFQLVNYNFDQIGNKDNYENINLNKDLIDRLSDTCYLPANALLMDIIKRSNKKFKAAISISGTTIELFELYRPDVLKSFNKLFETGCIEVVAETYYHSLSAVYAPAEFSRQVKLHAAKIKKHFNISTKVFSNTGFPIDNALAENVAKLGFNGMLSEGLEPHIQGHSTKGVLGVGKLKNFGLLVKNRSLSEDISVKFSDKSWSEFPLSAAKYAGWIETMPADTELINLFMEYATLGVNHSKASGIFEFLGQVADAVSKSKRFEFQTPSQVLAAESITESINLPHADKLVFAGMKNKMQEDAIKAVYKIEKTVLDSGNKILLSDWGKMQSMEHLLNMSVDQWVRGGEHPGYFDNPYDAHISYMNILKDIEEMAAPKKTAATIEIAPDKKSTPASKKAAGKAAPAKEEEKLIEKEPAKSKSVKKEKAAAEPLLIIKEEKNTAKGRPAAAAKKAEVIADKTVQKAVTPVETKKKETSAKKPIAEPIAEKSAPIQKEKKPAVKKTTQKA
jgi:alpha-amylase